ncbi:hypothetical protein [Actinophytocola xanthii]|nr:hypothetical protein [Actinophytocola xanthii]
MGEITTLLAATEDEALAASGAMDVDLGEAVANSIVVGAPAGV